MFYPVKAADALLTSSRELQREGLNFVLCELHCVFCFLESLILFLTNRMAGAVLNTTDITQKRFSDALKLLSKIDYLPLDQSVGKIFSLVNSPVLNLNLVDPSYHSADTSSKEETSVSEKSEHGSSFSCRPWSYVDYCKRVDTFKVRLVVCACAKYVYKLQRSTSSADHLIGLELVWKAKSTVSFGVRSLWLGK